MGSNELHFVFPQHQESLPCLASFEATINSKIPETIAQPYSFDLRRAVVIGILVGLYLMGAVGSTPLVFVIKGEEE